VFTVVEYLLEQKGWDGVRRVIDRMRDGKGDARAVADVLGVSFDQFQEAWRSWLRGKKLKTHPGLVPSSLKFVAAAGKKAKAQPPSDADEVQEIGEERARKLARLGGMLRARGRLAPAAMEYEKAETLVGPGHPQVANKLARTWLELGELDKAIAAAAPAFDLYPDLAAPAATLGEAYLRKHDPAKARPYLEAAIRVSPFDPAPHCALADIYRATDGARADREHAACSALQGG
jgi:tetratricopeptide (TPR) repeat protein